MEKKKNKFLFTNKKIISNCKIQMAWPIGSRFNFLTIFLRIQNDQSFFFVNIFTKNVPRVRKIGGGCGLNK